MTPIDDEDSPFSAPVYDVSREGHQFYLPIRETTDGTIRVRVMNVSISTPTATEKPSCNRSLSEASSAPKKCRRE